MNHALISALWYLIRVIPCIAAGIFLVNIVENLGLTRKFSWLARPLMRFGHLSDGCGISFLTCFGSPSAANAMLMNLYNKGTIGKRELTVAVLSNSFPMIVMHWRSMLPVILPLLGRVGLFYFGILVLVGFIKTFFVLVLGRFILQKKEYLDDETKIPVETFAFWNLVKRSVFQSFPLMKRILFITVPTTFLVFFLVEKGFFDMLGAHLKGITKIFPVPPEGLSIVAAWFGHHVAAYTAAGNLLATGILNSKGVILSLIVGEVLTIPISTFRWSAPYYIGVFGGKLGMQLMLLSTGVRAFFTIGMIFALYFLW